MKKIILLLSFALSLLSFSSAIASVADIDSFKGYKWGTHFKETAFWRIDENLIYDNTDKQGMIEITYSIHDNNGNFLMEFSYRFDDDRLSMGNIEFRNHSDFEKVVQSFEAKYGQPQKSHNGLAYYNFPSTYVIFEPTTYGNRISFISQNFLKGIKFD